MTIYNAGGTGLPRPAVRAGTLLVFLAAAVAGCDVEWGGASVRLENPAAGRDAADSVEAPPPPVDEPLPVGPLVYAVAVSEDRTAGLVVPIARIEGGSVAPLGLPERPDSRYRTRLDSAFLSPGTELALQRGGERIGSVILGGPTLAPRAACASVAPGRLLLLPGQAVPSFALATPPGAAPADPRPVPAVQVDDRIRTFAPILAETLLREAGERRPFLAQRADLVPVPMLDDQRPAMAATYLINDALGAGDASGDAVSLFFLARFEPTRGYVPVWSEVRRYGPGGGREIFSYVDAIGGPGGRVDFLARHDLAGRRLAASREPAADEQRKIEWTEPPLCVAADVLGAARMEG